MAQSIIDQFQRVLGRAPRPDEVSYFTKFLNEETLSPLEIGQILQSSPEYQQTLLKRQGQEYEGYLAASDAHNLGRAQEDITSQYRNLGRPDSSGVAGAFASAAKDLAARRQDALASFYGGGLQNISGAYSQQGQGAQQRGYALTDRRQQRAWDLEDYYRQRDDYNAAMKSQSGMNLKNQLIGGAFSLASSGIGGYASGAGLKAGLGLLGGRGS